MHGVVDDQRRNGADVDICLHLAQWEARIAKFAWLPPELILDDLRRLFHISETADSLRLSAQFAKTLEDWTGIDHAEGIVHGPSTMSLPLAFDFPHDV
jgi:hypothetical protein